MVSISQFGNVPANLRGNAEFTISIVNEVFAAFPNRFRFTSGYRTPAQNEAANGVANSYHVKAEAADFVPVNGTYPAGEKEAIADLISKYGYEVIKHNAGSGQHYHIEPMPSGKHSPSGGGLGVGQISTGVLMLAFLAIFLILDD